MNYPISNFDTGTSKLLQTETISSQSFAIGQLLIQNGTITGLANPTQNTNAVTKIYTDQFTNTNISLPNYSIQLNSGSVFVGTNALTYNPINNQVILNNTLNIGNISISYTTISNISLPNVSSGACSLAYLINNNIMINTLTNNLTSTNLTQQQIVNSYLIRNNTLTSGYIQDILPSGLTLFETSFKFIYYYAGSSTILLYSGTNNNIIPQGNYLWYSNPMPVITVSPNTIINFTAIVSDFTINFYINTITSLYSTSMLTSDGVVTDNFLSKSLIIYPVIPPTNINSSSSVTYTYNQLATRLIIRSGLTSNTTDNIVDVSTFTSNNIFSHGSGSFIIVIQNISSYNLTIGSTSTGWTFDTNNIIPEGMNGIFNITYNSNTGFCSLITIGIVNRSIV